MTELNHEATFPKSGRVNEVCREWSVREDSALAQQLQSQEINEHYRGNRFRNQVVRQDFPTALSEQIKEEEEAEQQSALYHQMMNAQAEADAVIARKIAENLRREQELERRRNIEKNEFLARQFEHDLLLETSQQGARMPPSQHSPNASEPIINELPIPPKKLGMKFNGQRRNYNDGGDMVTNPSYVTGASSHAMSVAAAAAAVIPSTSSSSSSRDSPQLNYVSLELNIPKDGQKRLANHHATQYTQVFAHNPSTPPAPLSPSDSESHHYEHINLHSHTPEKKVNPQPASSSSQPYVQRDYNFPPAATRSDAIALPPKPNKQQPSPPKVKSSSSSSMQYELPKLPPKAKDLSPTNRAGQMQLLTTDSFDMLMGNHSTVQPTSTVATVEMPDECDSLAIGGVDPKVARNSERVFNSNTPNINRIDSIDDILSYDGDEAAAGTVSSSERIRKMKELGVPPDEILEIDRRLTQQEKDEELARRLQEEEAEQISMTQEEKDRMVAIEAQDKELARMLQEREKAKARRAKERARARKQQLQQEKLQQEAAEASAQYVENSSAVSHTRSHSDSNDIEHDSYSDPIDLINARENAKQSSYSQAGEYYHSKQSSSASRDSLFHSGDEPYSNPVDSLRNATAIDKNHNASPPRPSKKQSSKAPRPKSNESLDNVDPSMFPNSSSSGHSGANQANESQNFLPAHLKYTTPDQNSNNPIPPYMPIQGVRRNGNVSSEKKKKPKDSRCTHQ